MKKMIAKMVSLPDKCYNKFVVKYRKIKCAGNLKIYGKLRVFGHGRIEIGKNVTINSSLSSNPIGGDSRTIFSLKNDARLVIGDSVGISNASIVCHSMISIGARSLIGGGTKIYDTDFHSLDYRQRGDYANEMVKMKPVSIGCDVFIGAHSIILKGVTIGDRSIIGAGSVVTKNIPADEVWGGNPARRIRSLTQETEETDESIMGM